MISPMDTHRRKLMARRDLALAAKDYITFQALTKAIADLPLAGVPALTKKDIARYVTGKPRKEKTRSFAVTGPRAAR
jgi:hypothetical protein